VFAGAAGICASPTSTAERFGVPWSQALTQWGNIKSGKPCSYDPSRADGPGAPGEGPNPDRGTADKPALPLTGELLYDTYIAKCGTTGGQGSNPSAEEISCMEAVDRALRSRGYNISPWACRAAGGEGPECWATPIDPADITGDFRNPQAAAGYPPDSPVWGGTPPIVVADPPVYIDDSDGWVIPPINVDPPVSVDPDIDPATGERYCPALYPHGRIDNLNQLICWSDDPDAWRRATTPGYGNNAIAIAYPGASGGPEPGGGGQFYFGGNNPPAGGGSNFLDDYLPGAVADFGSDEWIDGVPNWATLGLAAGVAATGVVMFSKGRGR